MIGVKVGDDDRGERLRLDAGTPSSWIGLPPQSISRAPFGATTTIDVVSQKDADGTEPDVPRNAKCFSA